MSHARSQHPNERLTPAGRRRMVDCVLGQGWTVEATAERFQVDAKTVRRWRDRFRAEGPDGVFSMLGATGELRVADNSTLAASQSYLLEITVSDGTLAHVETVTVDTA